MLKASLLLLAASAVAIAIGLYRLQDHDRFAAFMGPHACIRYRAPQGQFFVPSCTAESVIEGRRITYRINEIGLRERPEAEIKPGQVLVVGDSSVEGVGLLADETFSAVLERETRDSLGLQFINVGIRNTGPSLQASRSRRLLDRLKPRYILWFLTENDFDDERLAQIMATRFDKNGAAVEFDPTRKSQGSPALGMLFHSLDTWRDVPRVAIFRSILAQRFSEASISGIPDDKPICSGVLRLLGLAGYKGAQVAFVILPFSPAYESYVGPEAWKRLKRATELIASCASGPVFDLRGTRVETDASLFQGDLMHLHAQGVEFAVAQFKDALVKSWSKKD